MLAAGRVALLVLGAISLLVGTAMAVESFSASRTFDLDVLCAQGDTTDCLQRESGVTRPGGFIDDVNVSYDDGRRTTGVILRASEGPPPGTRVWLERWEIAGQLEVVALVDRESERRYRTHHWPERWDASAIGTALVGLALLVAVLLPKAMKAIARRRRESRNGVQAERESIGEFH